MTWLQDYTRRARHTELEWTHLGSRGSMPSAMLANMYVEAEFVCDGKDPAPLTARDILESSSDFIVVRGLAGSGKTTWIRHLLHELLNAGGTIPILLKVREFFRARRVRKSVTFKEWILEKISLLAGGPITEQDLKTASDPIILMIDGWDEAGDSAAELFVDTADIMELTTKSRAILTTRPQATIVCPPTFTASEYIVVPLSEDKMNALVRNYTSNLQISVPDRILHHIVASEAARLPLTLIIMLEMIHVDPDLDVNGASLLGAFARYALGQRADERKAEGAVDGPHVWAPSDHAARLRLASRIAWHMHSSAENRETAEYSLDMSEALPEWNDAGDDDYNSPSFVRWLTEVAGLMAETGAGTVQFTHLSIQEYLAAVHLVKFEWSNNFDISAFGRLSGLRLFWDMLIHVLHISTEWSPDELQNHLSKTIQGYWFLGYLFCDQRTAPLFNFESWASKIEYYFAFMGDEVTRAVAETWKARNFPATEMGSNILAQLGQRVFPWDASRRFSRWWSSCGYEEKPELKLDWYTEILSRKKDGDNYTADLAVRRVLAHNWPLWCDDDPGILAARIWPSPMALLGWRVQTAISLGVHFDDAIALCTLPSYPLSFELVESAQNNIRNAWEKSMGIVPDELWSAFSGQTEFSSGAELEDVISCKLAALLSKEVVVEYLHAALWAGFEAANLKDIILARTQHIGSVAAIREFTHYLNRNRPLGGGSREEALWWEQSSSDSFIVSSTRPGWWQQLTSLELGGWGGGGAWSLLCIRSSWGDSRLDALSLACHIRLSGTTEKIPELTGLAEYISPVWSALAKYIAGLATDRDISFLLKVAKEPESLRGSLSEQEIAALRVFVRGDVVLPDGRLVKMEGIPLLKRLSQGPRPAASPVREL